MEFVLLGLGTLVIVTWVVILGVMRELTVVRSELAGFKSLITKPPAPTFMNGILPHNVAAALPALPATPRRALVFVTPGCGGCQELMREIGEALHRGHLRREDLAVVVSGASERSAFVQEVRKTGVPVVLDESASLAKQSEVRATPTTLVIDPGSSRVVDYVVGGNAEWIQNRLQA